MEGKIMRKSKYLNKTFGKDKMKECIEYLLRLKKMS